MNGSDELVARCMALSSSLLMAFPTKSPMTPYLPNVLHVLLQAHALPPDLVPSLSFVASVIQQLSQGQYVDPSAIHSSLYQLQVPPLSAFVLPPPAPYGLYRSPYPPAPFGYFYPAPPPQLQRHSPSSSIDSNNNSSELSPPLPASEPDHLAFSSLGLHPLDALQRHSPSSSIDSNNNSSELSPPLPASEPDHLAFSSLGLHPLDAVETDAPTFEPQGSPVLSENDQELSLSAKPAPSFGMICSPRHRVDTAPRHDDDAADDVEFTFAKDMLLHDFGEAPRVYVPQENNDANEDEDDGTAFHALQFDPFLAHLTTDEPTQKEPQSPSTSSERSGNDSDQDDDDNDKLEGEKDHGDDASASPTATEDSVDEVVVKRGYLYDAPTPQEIQKQSIQIHAPTELRCDMTADDVRAATTSWVDRMQADGHAFDEKAVTKFLELATADPFRAVGITVSFELRKESIQNKSAWLSRACFNCQRKYHPPTGRGRRHRGQKATKASR
ncbi:hypothetical protein SPRG_00541 [Saprolegnia parasitica CBS 223.65]|uniref:Uncharacterized protein n=1 Tax=Saprolegnia parasitica (strain CBS 223.65) TaxID=695850 RepID=A0A067D639_SAPPC|nr:hypothetical protein SPRG_00541 [Saprolegnia parasitica CBS 223.65]KDO34477.1 hypothetical protein SPRG_00541 [Saprolegnia parasitica CBS 223.65]|eukprot:XP_012194158.1 hypothetical protein SPRG_00541 [Saprolegnia parasitica CBS 223.65]